MFEYIIKLDIKPQLSQVKWAVSLLITDGHQGFVWVCMGQPTHFITPLSFL